MPTDSARALQAKLLAQLAYFAEEITLLRGRLDHLPDESLFAQPFNGELSIGERLRNLALADERERLPTFRNLIASSGSSLPPAADLSTLDTIVQQIVQGRSEMVELLQGLDSAAWDNLYPLPSDPATNLYSYLHRLVTEDAEALREIALHLYETRLAWRRRSV